jgi:hypothetical protein
MDVNWLIAVRRALTVVGALQPFAKRACALLARLFNIEAWRDGERLRNEAEEIRNMQAFGKLVGEYARQMKANGASSTEIDALLADLLLTRLRSYMRARGIVASRTPRTAKRRQATTAMPAQAGNPEHHVSPALMERRNTERRTRQGARNDDGSMQ